MIWSLLPSNATPHAQSFRAVNTCVCRTAAPLDQLDVPGSAMLVHLGEDEFLCLGRSLIFTFTGPSGYPAELISVDLGECRDCEWHHGRRVNGDETAHGTGILLSNLDFIQTPNAALSETVAEERPRPALDLCRFRIFNPKE